ncbi:MAG: START-like domain-containing protein [Bacteroidota bacterium]
MSRSLSTTKKKLFTADFEVHASVKMLYPYIQTASGLSEWFADDVTISPEKVFKFVWDHETRKAIMSGYRTNHFCKFEFLPESEDDKKDPSYFELRIEINELTQTTFLKVFDYSDFDDMDELNDLWESLVEKLKKVVGG